MFYLPLLEPRAEMEDDEDFLEEDQEHPVDLVVPLKKSVKQILREVRFILCFLLFFNKTYILEQLNISFCHQSVNFLGIKLIG